MNKDITRREFLSINMKIATAAGITATIPLIGACESDREIIQPILGITIDIDLNEDNEIRSLRNGWGIVRRYPNVNKGIHIIIVRLDSNKFSCFSSLCTHDSCFGNNLFVQPRRAIIACECHGSEFDAADKGKVLKGPAEKPLKEFPVEFNGETQILSIFF